MSVFAVVDRLGEWTSLNQTRALAQEKADRFNDDPFVAPGEPDPRAPYSVLEIRVDEGNGFARTARSQKVQQYVRAFNRTFKRHGFDPLQSPLEFAGALATLTKQFWNEFGLLHGLRRPSEATRALVIAKYAAMKPLAKAPAPRVIETTGEELSPAEVA